MKLAFISNNMKIGGVQVSLLNLLEDLVQEHDVTLILFAKTGELLDQIPSTVRIVEAGESMIPLGLSHGETKGTKYYIPSLFLRTATRVFGFSSIIRGMLRNAEEYAGFDYAISYLHDSTDKKFYGGCNQYTLEKVGAEKKVSFFHADCSVYNNLTAHNRMILDGFDHIVLVSDSCKKLFDKMAPELSVKTTVVKNRIHVDKIRYMAGSGRERKSCDCIRFVSVCRLAKEKGILRLLRAFHMLQQQFPGEVKLDIVGDGPLKMEIMNLISDYHLEESVTLHGEQANPYPFINDADVLVISSYHEAAPMVIGEAFALGKKVLSTRTSSADEMIPEDRGWVCDNSEEGIHKGLIEVMEEINI